MITEKQLIVELKKLRQIKPQKKWVVFTKRRILGDFTNETRISVLEVFKRIFFQPKLAWVTVLSAFILICLSGLSMNSLPGDLLYPIKKIAEKSQVIFVSNNEKSELSLELVNKRLEEVNIIAQTNQVKKLAPAIQEYQANMSQAAKDLARATSSDSKIFKAIVEQTQKLEENKKKAESLGVIISDNEELNTALSQLIDREIKELNQKTLNAEQSQLLVLAKEDFEAGNYNQALEKILILSYLQN